MVEGGWERVVFVWLLMMGLMLWVVELGGGDGGEGLMEFVVG